MLDKIIDPMGAGYFCQGRFVLACAACIWWTNHCFLHEKTLQLPHDAQALHKMLALQ